MAELNLKKYTIQLTTKGAYNIECGRIEIAEGANVEDVLNSITYDDINNYTDFKSHDGLENYIELNDLGNQCMSDEYEDSFELKVLDEEENVIFTANNFYDCKMLTSDCFLDAIEDYYENEDEIPDIELLQRMQKVISKQYEEDKKRDFEGYCVLVLTQMKSQTATFEIEDYEFDPNKLFFMENPCLRGAYMDYYTDQSHVMYGDEILEDPDPFYFYDYGVEGPYIAKRNDGWFEIIRELNFKED